jgi:hypothetical protein
LFTFLRESLQFLAVLGILHPIQLEEILEIAHAQTNPAGLDSADPRSRAFEGDPYPFTGET